MFLILYNNDCSWFVQYSSTLRSAKWYYLISHDQSRDYAWPLNRPSCWNLCTCLCVLGSVSRQTLQAHYVTILVLPQLWVLSLSGCVNLFFLRSKAFLWTRLINKLFFGYRSVQGVMQQLLTETLQQPRLKLWWKYSNQIQQLALLYILNPKNMKMKKNLN